MRTIIALLGMISMISTPISLVVFFIQLIRRQPTKWIWGIIAIGCAITFVICMLVMPSNPDKSNDVEPTKTEAIEPTKTEAIEPTKTEAIEPTKTEAIEPTKTEAEKFAAENNTSVELAKSLETVLNDMKLTDKSRVGIFHYNLSHVYNWKRVDDWANGERYQAWMDMEHVWIIYVKGNMVVGIRDTNGNALYLDE